MWRSRPSPTDSVSRPASPATLWTMRRSAAFMGCSSIGSPLSWTFLIHSSALVGHLVGTGFFVVGYVYVYSGIFIALASQRAAHHKLQCTHGVAVLANQKAV